MHDPGDEHVDPTDMGTHKDWEGTLFVGDNDHMHTIPVPTPLDQFQVMEDTRSFLRRLTTDSSVSQSIRDEATELSKRFPDTWDTGWLISRATKWTQYIDLSNDAKMHGLVHSPVDYIPAEGGWVFWFEDWAMHSKPYHTFKEANAALEEYTKTLGL